MTKLTSKVTGINVEVLGRRLSFTYEEAMALRDVLCDALAEPYVDEPESPIYEPPFEFFSVPGSTHIKYWCNSDVIR